MRKYVIYPFLILILVVAGCSSNNDKPEVTGNNGLEQPLMEQPGLSTLKASDIQEVKLSRSLQFGVVNEAMLSVFTEQADIELFIQAISTAKKIEGKMDIRRPDYDVTLLTKDATHSIHLWLDTDNDIGTYTQVSDTGTGYTLNEEASSNLKRLIMNVPYTSVQAEQNGDIVNMHGKLLNLDKWDTFLTNIQRGTIDQVQVTNYTTEGDPIFYNLNFIGESIEYTFDTTMDAFGTPQRVSIFCERIESQDTDEGTQYSLAGCQGNKGIEETFGLVIPKS
jgi:hypothetical protein